MKKRIGASMAVLAAFMTLPLAAWAEEGSGGGSGSLPQLDVTTYPGQLFWLAVTFPVLFLLMRFFIVPGLQGVQGARRQTLQGDLGEASKANDEAKVLRESYESALAQAKTKAHGMLAEIAAAAAEEEAKRRAVQQKELERRVVEAEERVGAFRTKALAEAREASADLAEAMVKQLLGQKGA